MGGLGADLYKAEVPLHGDGDEAAVREGCAALIRALPCPWVVLSSGVPRELSPRAVEWACKEGTSGFLAGRAVWRAVIGTPNAEAALRADAVPRLRALGELVDRVVGQAASSGRVSRNSPARAWTAVASSHSRANRAVSNTFLIRMPSMGSALDTNPERDRSPLVATAFPSLNFSMRFLTLFAPLARALPCGRDWPGNQGNWRPVGEHQHKR